MSFLSLYLKNESTGELTPFPAVFSSKQPVICWDLPEGIIQTSYCLELKTKDKTILSSGQEGYAYYSSGLIYSNETCHKILFEMFPEIWGGVVECRVRMFDEDGRTIFSTHQTTSLEYDFEPVAQGFSWNSDYDGYFLLMDSDAEFISNTMSPTFTWRNVSDIDSGQSISYELQWSKTPLFDLGLFNRNGITDVHTESIDQKNGLRSNFSTQILVEGPIFYRIRAFDGLDYGEWSKVNGFLYSPSYSPICVFDSVVSNCTSSDSNSIVRPNGEVFISFHVIDIDSEFVSVFLSYEINDVEIPLSMSSSLTKIPTGENLTVVWPSARQMPNESNVVKFKMYANDGSNQSEIVQFEYPVLINNTGIGYGNGDIGGDDLSYRILSHTKSYESWIQIPNAKAERNIVDGAVSYSPRQLPEPKEGEMLIEPFSWKDHWLSKLGSDYSSHFFWIGENYNQFLNNKIVRNYFSLYNGFNDHDDHDDHNSEQLMLQYEDEFEATKKNGEVFCEYLQDNIEACKKWCSQQNPKIEYSENTVKLGKSIKDVQFFIKEPLYGKSINIRGSNIIKAGTSGLYYDGMVLENSSDQIFKSDKQIDSDNENQTELPLPDGASDLKKSEVWKHWYQLDRMYEPKRSSNNSSDNSSLTIVGPNIERRFDKDGYWYWQLFEYSLSVNFP